MSEVTPAYCWGRVHPAELFRPPGSAPMRHERPALPDWDAIDQTIAAAMHASPLDIVVALAPTDAENVARVIYVFYEPMVDAVIALGHADRSISWHVTDTLVRPNEAALRAILDDAGEAIRLGALASALEAIAAGVRRLDGPQRRR